MKLILAFTIELLVIMKVLVVALRLNMKLSIIIISENNLITVVKTKVPYI